MQVGWYKADLLSDHLTASSPWSLLICSSLAIRLLYSYDICHQVSYSEENCSCTLLCFGGLLVWVVSPLVGEWPMSPIQDLPIHRQKYIDVWSADNPLEVYNELCSLLTKFIRMHDMDSLGLIIIAGILLTSSIRLILFWKPRWGFHSDRRVTLTSHDLKARVVRLVDGLQASGRSTDSQDCLLSNDLKEDQPYQPIRIPAHHPQQHAEEVMNSRFTETSLK